MIFPTDLKHNLYKRRKFIRIQISFSDLNMLYFNVKTLNSCRNPYLCDTLCYSYNFQLSELLLFACFQYRQKDERNPKEINHILVFWNRQFILVPNLNFYVI